MNMLTFLGYSLIFLAMLTSAFQVVNRDASGEGIIRNSTSLTQVAPFLLLVLAFMIEATSLKLVSDYVGEGLPLFYRISAVWGSRSGPLLMWAAIMGGIAWAMSREENPDKTAIRIMHAWISLLLLIAATLRPFSPSVPGPRGEINPLLQTDLMVVHPPVVFVYYSLCLATASIAMAGFLRSRPSEETHASMLKWARYSFLAGAIGIGLGGLWAYTVLDWGGYWAWDPVETGSLLPWLALLAIVHARARPADRRPFSLTPSLALITGALVMHATLVTRANGVWASVHAFVGDGQNSMPSDPYLRVLQIVDFSAIGFEVLSYLAAVVFLLTLSLLHALREQREEIDRRGSKSLFEENRNLALAILVYFAIVGAWIGSSAILFIGLAILLLLVSGDHKDPPAHWVALGVILMLFSSWGWVSEWYQSLAGIAPFLLIWMMPEDDQDDLSSLKAPFVDTRSRTRVSRSSPWYLSIALLLLTWVLLTVEIDGTNIAAHEYYGAPILSLMAIGLAAYAWGSWVSARNGSLAIAVAVLASVLLAAYSGSFELPGNQDLPITDSVSRGALAMFILTWVVFSIPPTIAQLARTIRRNAPLMASRGKSLGPANLRVLGSHLAHAGVLILLVGHVLTTTLVDRTDPSHFLTLEKDKPTEHMGMELVFTGVEIFSAEDEGYEFGIGDGYVGVVIELSDGDKDLGTLNPGMLRFDPPDGNGIVSARSEVDRVSSLTGDTIAILDFQQSNELLSSMILGNTDQVQEVRVTVHHLTGSHLVWAGWLMIMAGILLASATPATFSGSEEE